MSETESNSLTLNDLRQANQARQSYWGGSENWTLADWSNALAGEVGEACNVVKKLRRPELGTVGNKHDQEAYRQQLASEIGDVLIYLDLLANAAGYRLEHCVMKAFNDKSEELDMPIRLEPS
jgi:NTP pyrophosphatase (non-canonical NTP hydrolase)